MGSFHVGQGFYLESDEAGDVSIVQKDSPAPNAPVVRTITVPKGQWPSIVAALSVHGESADAITAAKALHMGESIAEEARGFLGRLFHGSKTAN